MTMVQVVNTGMKMVLQQHRARIALKARKDMFHSGTPAALNAYRWSKVPPEERSRLAREMARKRWAKNRKADSG